MLAQSITETEIANKLNVDQSTISRDIKALKQMSQRFVFDLAKSDLAYHYQQCVNGIEEVRRKAWELLRREEEEEQHLLTLRDKLDFEVDKRMRRKQICIVQRWTIHYECKIIRRENTPD